MEISKERLQHIKEVLDKEEITYLSQRLSKWYPNAFKEPVFTSYDGVDIYEGDRYYVPQRDYKDRLVGTLVEFICDSSTNIIEKEVKRFSSPQKAQEYVDLNMPKYTEKDMLLAINNWSVHPIDIEDIDKFLKKLNNE